MSTALPEYTLELRPTGCARPTIPVDMAALQLVRAYKMIVSKYRHTIPKFKDIKLAVSASAPETMKGLQEDLEQGKLRVSPEHSSQSLYGDVGNLWFRWFHDMGHLATGLRMHHKGETDLAKLQLSDVYTALSTLGMSDTNVSFCAALYMADSAAQSDHLVQRGEFPVDQKQFVLDTVQAWGWEVPDGHTIH